MKQKKRADGALEDSTTVGFAKANSEIKDLYIAIGKAANYIESPPKERHVRKIFSETSVIQPQADGVYNIHALSKRLSKTRTWVSDEGVDNHSQNPGIALLGIELTRSFSKSGMNSQLPVLGWLLLEMQKDQQPLTVSSVLNLCMVQMFRRKGAMAKSHAMLSFPA
ncbi:hypothetical protein F2Q69_00002023 [Brassica cretica]|uniref:AP180 N-terminal homology (ANTH) domain-containing protein n=1 Tax=Brassica cretica TaxID=69181 RepID=A0A8S9PK84_BRACR|nr:hypothetical protein F2Q69_00002023 [Brassica cretica]